MRNVNPYPPIAAGLVGISLLAGTPADAQTLQHPPSKLGMKACHVEVPLGNEVTSLLCLNAGVALLSNWKEQKPEERAWHEQASRAAFALARQAYRNAHPRPAELYYGAALVSVGGIPHAIPNREKKALCEDASAAFAAGCRLERCASGSEGPLHSDRFSEISHAYRTACVRPVPPVCTWDPKKPPVCQNSIEPITREWSRYSGYVLALPRVRVSAERLLPLLEKWRVALEAYELQVFQVIDKGSSGGSNGGSSGGAEPSSTLAPVVATGLEARKNFELALWEAQNSANQKLTPTLKQLVQPLMAAWKQALPVAPEVNGFEGLQLYDSQVEAIQSAVLGLTR